MNSVDSTPSLISALSLLRIVNTHWVMHARRTLRGGKRLPPVLVFPGSPTSRGHKGDLCGGKSDHPKLDCKAVPSNGISNQTAQTWTTIWFAYLRFSTALKKGVEFLWGEEPPPKIDRLTQFFKSVTDTDHFLIYSLLEMVQKQALSLKEETSHSSLLPACKWPSSEQQCGSVLIESFPSGGVFELPH